MRVALVALAGATGALARYAIWLAVGARSFPWPTLAINLSGSLLLAFVLTFGTERGWSPSVTVPLAIGFLGAYTTFSTFSYETFALVRNHRAALAAIYVAVSVAGGILAALAGYGAARKLA
ncbi:hypothetical protein BH10ACT2_BH10ACT2_20580 [soil metagenome]